MAQQSFHTPDLMTSSSTGAILGEDTGEQFVCITVPAGKVLTTPALEVGDSGEASSCAALTVEMWFQYAAAPSGTINLFCGPQPVAGARQWQFTLSAANIISFTVHGAGGNYTVATPALANGVWYHFVGTITGGSLRLYQNGVQVASTAWADTIVTGFNASASLADLQIGDNSSNVATSYDELAFYRVGLSAARVLAHYQAGQQRGFPTQVSGTRVNAVLDAVGSTAPRRISAGVRTMTPSYWRGASPLSAIKQAVVADAIDSVFFAAADGTLVFLAADQRSSSPYNTLQATFDDDGTDTAYLDLETDYSLSFLFNEWNVTRAAPGALTQTASDATSISKNFKRPQSATGLPLTTDADCLTIATAMLAKYKDPLYRITSITFTTVDKDIADVVLQRELMDKVRIIRTPHGGGARIQQDVFIQKIDIAGANAEPWTIRWAVSPL